MRNPGGVVAVNLHRLAELRVESEADDHSYVLVDLQLPSLTELLGVLDGQRVQPKAGGEAVDDLIGRVLDVQPEGLTRLDELGNQRRGWLLVLSSSLQPPRSVRVGAGHPLSKWILEAPARRP
jgi:hypothetical protein